MSHDVSVVRTWETDFGMRWWTSLGRFDYHLNAALFPVIKLLQNSNTGRGRIMTSPQLSLRHQVIRIYKGASQVSRSGTVVLVLLAALEPPLT